MSNKRYKVLFLSVNDENLEPEKEYKEIESALSGSPNKMVTLLPHKSNVDVNIFHQVIFYEIRNLSTKEELIIHFCGHSNEFGMLLEGVPENDRGEQSVGLKPLKRYFGDLGRESKKIALIIFSSCQSVDCAESLRDIYEIYGVIGFTRTIGINEALKFCKGFYSWFVQVLDIEESYRYAYGISTLTEKEIVYYGHFNLKDEVVPVVQPMSALDQLLQVGGFSTKRKNEIDELVEEIFNDINQINNTPDEQLDFSLCNDIKKTVIKLNNIEKGFQEKFERFSEIEPKNITPSDKVIIFNWKKRLVFEYGVTLSTKLSELVETEAYHEFISKWLEKLINAYALNILNNKVNDSDFGGKAIVLKNMANEVKLCLERQKGTEMMKANFYMSIFNFVNLITIDKFDGIEKETKNQNNMNNLIKHIHSMKKGREGFRNEMNTIIPFNLS